MLFSFDELIAATGGTPQGGAFDGVSTIVIDSRDVPEGALFVAIKGDRFDGHEFVRQAIENGAAAALVAEEKQDEFSGDLPLVAVDDPLKALERLAVYSRERSQAKIVAVTGSVGKTTTKEALRHVLSGFGKTHASIKSYNNHWGVPLMLANLPKDAEFGVFEIGMNHSGEITPLTKMVQPHIALITAIGPAHIGELGSMEAIVDAKAEIFLGLEPGGSAICNADHDYIGILRTRAEAVDAGTIESYGFAETADAAITDLIALDPLGVSARVERAGEVLQVKSVLTGQHMVSNLVGAGLVALRLGLDWNQIAERLESFEAVDGRGKTTWMSGKGRRFQLVDESYNANPVSMRAALDVFANIKNVAGRLLVLGDMYELGEEAERWHVELAESVKAADPDQLVLVGEHMAALGEVLKNEPFTVTHVKNTDAAGIEVMALLDKSDLVMLKGSLGVGLGQLVASIRKTYNQE